MARSRGMADELGAPRLELCASPSRRRGGGECHSDPAVSRQQLSDLLVRSGRGDVHAFAELYDVTCARIYGLVLHSTTAALAEDLTRAVYVGLWHRAGTYLPGGGHPMTWIIVLAQHQLAQHQPAQYQLAGKQRGSGCVPLGGVTGYQGWHAGTLTGLQHEALVLLFLGRYSARQVGELLDLPAHVVTSAVRSGLSRLALAAPTAS